MAVLKNVVRKGLFRDSVQLLHISEEVKKIPGVLDAAVVMGTELNKELLRRQGLLSDEGSQAGGDDLIIAVKLEDGVRFEDVLRRVDELLTSPPTGEAYFYSIDSAINYLRNANLALISVPGRYAREVAMEFLRRGIHVHLFSDHVPIKDEVELKRYAVSRGLLLMGPEAGTSIINGVAIAFANAVGRGPVGIVAAAGTGLQEVSVLVARAGSGISQGIGVGGRDVKSVVGGIMTLFSIKALEADPGTDVITIVSKPPSPDVQERIVKYVVENGGKKYVTCFIGGRRYSIPGEVRGRVKQTLTLHAAAIESARLAGVGEEGIRRILPSPEELIKLIDDASSRVREGQRFIRGLFTGGTLAYESMVILKELVGDVWSNTPLKESLRLKDPWRSREHSVIDLGDEVFTAGRPHPMIDPTIRVERIVREAEDPEVAVIMLDLVLGYGSHPDPAASHVEAIRRARELARNGGRELIILAHVVGTDEDPQNASRQENLLRKAGVITLPSNALMALAAALISTRRVDESLIKWFYESFLKGE